jgi:2-polyprenyl-3-methyl-5-hydroxy-6-metoxy-1,4-benzoquinol methylase
MLEFEELSEHLISDNNCNNCEGMDIKEWGTRGILKLVECNKCGLVYINPRLNEEGLNKFYSNYFKKRLDNVALTNDRKKMYSLEVDLLLKHINHHLSIIDVGCGGGTFLSLFPDKFSKIGTDYDEVAVREALNNGIQCYKGDFLDLDINEAPLDIIIFRGVIEHVTNPKLTLEKASQMLSNEGLLYITSTPNLDSVCAEVYRGNWNLVGPDHLFYFNESILSGILNQNDMYLIAEHHFYEETPYKNHNTDYDILKKDLIKLRKGELIVDLSPPYWGNMMSLIYKKS